MLNIFISYDNFAVKTLLYSSMFLWNEDLTSTKWLLVWVKTPCVLVLAEIETVCVLFLVYLCSWGHSSRWDTGCNLFLWSLRGKYTFLNHAHHRHSYHGYYKGLPGHLDKLKHREGVESKNTIRTRWALPSNNRDTMHCHCASNQLLTFWFVKHRCN